MRRLIFLLMIMILPLVLLPASPADVEKDLEFFTGLGQRDDGSEAEAAAFSYIAESLEELGIGYRFTSLGNSESGHSFSSNLSALLPGSQPGRLIIAAPVDEGAFGLAFLLEMADYLQTNAPVHDVELLFLGAERGETGYHPYGGNSAAATTAELSDGSLLVYLNADEIPSSWQMRPGGNSIISPRWLVESITEVFTAQFVPFSLRGTDIQLARLGLQGDISLLDPWLEADIPSIMLSGRDVSDDANDRYRQIDRLKKALTDLDARLDDIPQNTRSSFVFLRPMADMSPVVIPELPYVMVFLALSAILLVGILARYRDVRLNVRRFSSRLWAWPLLMVLVFLYFFLATLFVEETLLLADFPELWKFSPGVFVFFKLSIAAALSLTFILLTRGLPLPKSPHFYSYMAVLTSGLASMVFIGIDITLAGYLVMTVVFFLLFTAVRNFQWKIVFLTASLIPYLLALIVIISEPYEVLLESILLNRIGGNILLTLILMPQILGITSLSYWRLHYQQTRSGVLTQTATFILNISAIITLVWIINMDPYGSGTLQPVILTDSINLNTESRRLRISSPAAIGQAVLSLEGSSYPLENLGRTAEVRTPLSRRPLEISYTGHKFLGRRTLRTVIIGEASPDQLDISIYSPEPFTLHDSDFPFERSADGRSAVIFIGSHPPFPLSLEFTVNGDAQISMDCTATWSAPEDPPGIDRKDLLTETSRVVRLTTPLN